MDGIDTNILVYAFDVSSNYHNAALSFIEYRILEHRLAIAEFSLLEFFAVITDGRKVKSPLLPEEVYPIISDFWHSQSFCILSLFGDDYRKIFKYAIQKKTIRNDIYDFFIAYTCKKHGIETIYTANVKDFKKLGFIEPINPFATNKSNLTNLTNETSKTNPFIPYGHQSINERDVAAVCSALRSDWLTTGPKVAKFEQAIADYVGAKYAVAVSSGTAALHCATYAIGISPGDEVIVSPMTFVATANAVVFQGGTPVFADVDPDTLLLNPAKVEERITARTKAIIGVDYAGQPCDWDNLRQITDSHHLSLVADGCHALGAEYKSCKVGTLADITAFSFHPVKHITTGEGGMIATDDPDLAEKMRRFRNHGIDADHAARTKQGTWRYEMTELGYNYRITDFQCALGISQLKRLPRFLERRREIAHRYDEAFASLPGIDPLVVRPDVAHAYHLYVVRIDPGILGIDRAALFTKLREKGIGVNVHYIPVHLQPFYRKKFHTGPGMCPVAEVAYEQIISLPMFPGMTDDQVEVVISVLQKIIQSNLK